jgi:DNA replication protein DnaC
VVEQSTKDRNSIIHLGRKQEFTFDHVFNMKDNNETVYNKVARPIVNSVLEGFNGTIFAYGMSGTGKSHSTIGTQNEPGIMRLCVK